MNRSNSSPSSQGFRRLIQYRSPFSGSPQPPYSNSNGVPSPFPWSTTSTETTSRISSEEDLQAGYEPAKLKLTGPLAALSCEPEGRNVAVAGKDVLKILSVKEAEVKEVYNLRISGNVINQMVHDVKWGNGHSAKKIATAVNNGAIHLWDPLKTGIKVERSISEHLRAVHRLSFQPNGGRNLLSAGQDGTMKLFDIREGSVAVQTFEGKAEAVRDVQFNPIKEFEFVAAFESGVIQKWDIRVPTIFERRLTAHVDGALTVDWHEDGALVVSGGRDRAIRVWDPSSELRRPLYTINTIDSVARVQWRPGRPNEIASSALLSDGAIRVWDVRRPWIARFSVEEHDLGPTGLAWVSTDVIYSVSKDKYFMRHDVTRGARRPIERLGKSAIGWNVYGDMAFATELKEGRVREFVDESTYPGLADSRTRRAARRQLGEEQLLYQPPKTSNIVHIPLFDYEWFAYAAQNYITSSADIWTACGNNAQVAYAFQRYRTSQTWRTLQLLLGQSSGIEKTPPTGGDSPNKEQDEDPSAADSRFKPMEEILEENEELSESGVNEYPNSRVHHSPTPPTTNNNRLSLVEPEDFEEESDEDFEDFSTQQPSAAFSGRPPTPSTLSASYTRYPMTPGSEGLGMKLDTMQPRRDWYPTGILEELLEYYTEQGDVQMCVTLSLVFENHTNVDKTQAGEWFAEYIDLLQRFRLWSAATAVTNDSKHPLIREKNTIDTTIYVNCSYCYKPVVNANFANVYWACERCRRLTNSCSICHGTVKGLYAWCQGCSHGGHLEHMRDWLERTKVCPTGCGHECEINTVNTMNTTNMNQNGNVRHEEAQ